MAQVSDEELYRAVDAAQGNNRLVLRMLGRMAGEMTDPTAALFVATLQLAVSSDSDLVDRLAGRLREVSGELEFRRSLDDVGTDGE